MPIYEQTYRRYEARGPLRTLRFWPITREGLRLVLVKRAFLLLLAVSWMPFLVRVIQVWAVQQFPEAGRVLPVDGRLFGEFLNGQFGLTMLIGVFGGAGLVANDLRTGAILVYLSRPLTRRDYVLGKLGVMGALTTFATVVPALLLYLIALGLAPETFMAWRLAWIAPAIVLHGGLISLVLSLLVLAVSALSRSARVAGISFVALFLGTEIVRGIVRAMYDRPLSTLVSVQASLRAVGNALFGITDRATSLPWYAPGLLLLALSVGCLLVLRSRVRAVEVVA